MSFRSMMKQPSALLPLAMSLAALTLLLGHIVMFGVVRETDEGTAAHLFQLLLVSEVPVVFFFLIKWLPRYPRRALQVLVVQALAALAALAPVYLLKL